ncbi:uncharacterized protein LOC135831277 [Planococcus citri]|uniref:uncharacterized protein LOC135831277 n=1 Tax=Planococcus citri TaxID=170843 RepID=UPI0031F8A21D
MASSSFPIQGGSQTELIQMLPFLLYSNHLRDFDNVGKYRRNLALYIGCSYIPRVLNSEQMYSSDPKLKKSVGHLLCYFCSKEKKIHTDTLSSCPMYTTRTEINDFPLLCKLITNEITMPCETTIVPCPKWKKSYSWFLPSVRNIEAQLEYETDLYDDEFWNKLNLTSTPDSKQPKSNVSRPPIKKIYITPKVILVDPYDKKFCIIIILMYVFIILLMVSTILLVCYFHLMNRQRIVYI